MKFIRILALTAFSVIFFTGSMLPVFAGGMDDDDGNYMYDDDGNYIEYEEYDPNEDVEEDVITSSFSTSWFDNHRRSKEYTITTAIQLQGLADLVNESRYDDYTNSANHYESFEGKIIKLGRDITVRDNFTPIGWSEDVCFKGAFDGNGHTIKGLDFNENGGDAGLFGYLDGTVRNLKLQGTVKSSGGECGAFAGYLGKDGVVQNCKSYVTVTGKAMTGGIVGRNDGGTITECVNHGDVTGTFKVGGIVGENRGKVAKCGNRGEVESSERGATTYGTGGVCGRSVSEHSVIERCFNTGLVSSGTEGTGGICGYMNARGSKIISCYNTGHLKVRNNAVIPTDNIRGYAGGIIGIAGMKGLVISDCYNTGDIDNSDISGGIIGAYLDESESTDDPYIRNNYYLSASGVKGVGSDFSGTAKNIREGTQRIAQATLISSASKLGNAYIEDSQNNYGADGYPVLRWQKKQGKVKRSRLTCVSADMQKNYDRFLAKNPVSERPEWPVIIFFNHSAFTSQAIGNFHE
ncbi:MAG: hypothetical protein K6B42_03980 [Clostridia bacterium]|nr:hypothetical protein [Clostridia bacterium]